MRRLIIGLLILVLVGVVYAQDPNRPSDQVIADGEYPFMMELSDGFHLFYTDDGTLNYGMSANLNNWSFNETIFDLGTIAESTFLSDTSGWTTYFASESFAPVIQKAMAMQPTGPWMLVDDTVFEAGDGWDKGGISPSIAVNPANGSIFLYFTGRSETDMTQIGLATSENGVDWAKLNDPVLSPGEPGSWDATSVGFPSVIYNDQSWAMFYWGASGNETGIGYATSTDGVQWEKYANNPIYTNTDPARFIYDVSVIQTGDSTYTLVYGERSTDTQQPIGIYTAPVMIEQVEEAPNGPTRTPTLTFEPVTVFTDDGEDVQNCHDETAADDPEVDIVNMSLGRDSANNLLMNVMLSEPLVNDYSFAVLTFVTYGDAFNIYVWEIHAAESRIGQMDYQTRLMIESSEVVITKGDQSVMFMIPSAELPDTIDSVGARSFHTPTEATQPQPTNCDSAGLYEVPTELR